MRIFQWKVTGKAGKLKIRLARGVKAINRTRLCIPHSAIEAALRHCQLECAVLADADGRVSLQRNASVRSAYFTCQLMSVSRCQAQYVPTYRDVI